MDVCQTCRAWVGEKCFDLHPRDGQRRDRKFNHRGRRPLRLASDQRPTSDVCSTKAPEVQ